MNIWRERLDIRIREFQERLISDDVFRADLYSAGFRGTRLNEEFNYQFGLRHQIEHHQSLNGKLRFSAA